MLSFIIDAYASFYIYISTILGSFGFGIIILSLLSSVLLLPLLRFAAKIAQKEQEYQDVLGPQVIKIKSESKGADLHNRIKKLYQRYGYHPIYSIRKLSVLFIQLPFLIITYYMLTDLKELSGQSFIIINNLGLPDGLLGGVNLLPITMTLINIAAALTMKGVKKNDLIQSTGLSVFFLIVLYKVNAGLLLYWNINNLVLLLKNIFSLFVAKKSGEHFENPLAIISVLKDDVKERLVAIKRNYIITQLLILSSLLFYMIAFQDLLFIISQERWTIKFGGKLFVLSGFALCISILFSLKNRFRYLLCLISMALIALAGVFIKSTESQDLFFYANNISVLLLALTTIFGLTYFPKNDKFQLKHYLFLGILAVVSGFTIHWSNNTDSLFPSILPLYFVIGIILAVTFCFLVLPHVRALHMRIPLDVLGASFLFVYVLFPSLNTLLHWKKLDSEFLFFFLIIIVLFSLVYSYKKTLLYLFFIFFVMTNTIFISNSDNAIKNTDVSRDSEINKRLKSFSPGLINKKNLPNIYLIVSESTPNLRTLKDLGVDASAFQQLLAEYDFKIYKSTCSLGETSLMSMGATFDIKAPQSKIGHNRVVVSGESLAHKWLQWLGYKTSIITKIHMTGPYSSYNDRYPIRVDSGAATRRIKIDYMSMILKGIGLHRFRWDITGYGRRNAFQEFKRTVILKKKTDPVFLYHHSIYPTHSQNSGKCSPDEDEIYKKEFKIAMKFLQKDLELIKKHDPSSITIIMGDHGPYLRGDCYNLNDYKNKDVSELMVRDRFSTIMAIRWPDEAKASKYDQSVRINQDLFPLILSYLYDSPRFLSLKLPPAFTYKGWIFKNGRFYHEK